MYMIKCLEKLRWKCLILARSYIIGVLYGLKVIFICKSGKNNVILKTCCYKIVMMALDRLQIEQNHNLSL